MEPQLWNALAAVALCAMILGVTTAMAGNEPIRVRLHRRGQRHRNRR